MGKCRFCGNIASFDLCYDCYYNMHYGKRPSQDRSQNLQNGDGQNGQGGFKWANTRSCGIEASRTLTESDFTFHKNIVKGRIAETLIEQLFRSMKYDVYRFGMENTVPGIIQHLKGMNNDAAANTIRRMPDLVAVDSDKHVFFLEIKYRRDESFRIEDLEKYPGEYPYENVHIIVVSKKHIKCITVDELRAGKEITPSSYNFLGNRNEFDLDKDTIIRFCDYAVTFFEHVDD